jgi:glycosyltransferase involved in cell wall biosynthesis
MLRAAAQADDRIRILQTDHVGVPAALNTGIAAARAPLIARMDADDIALPRRLEAQLEWLNDRPQVVVAGSWIRWIDARGRVLRTLRVSSDDAAIQNELMQGHTSIWHPAAVFRKNAFDQVGGYDTQFDTAQDLDLWLKMGEVGQLNNVPETLLDYRLHNSSISEQKRQRQRECGRIACENAARRRGVPCRHDAGQMWRPGSDRRSRGEYTAQYGWWAHAERERKTAMIYGLKTIATRPLWPEGYKLLAVAAIKPTGQEAA